jgi:hypothetical protein
MRIHVNFIILESRTDESFQKCLQAKRVSLKRCEPLKTLHTQPSRKNKLNTKKLLDFADIASV